MKLVRLLRCFSLPCASSSSDFTSSFFSLHSYIPVKRPTGGGERKQLLLLFFKGEDAFKIHTCTYSKLKTHISQVRIKGSPPPPYSQHWALTGGLRPGTLTATHTHTHITQLSSSIERPVAVFPASISQRVMSVP